jgi:hypothetical protein
LGYPENPPTKRRAAKKSPDPRRPPTCHPVDYQLLPPISPRAWDGPALPTAEGLKAVVAAHRVGSVHPWRIADSAATEPGTSLSRPVGSLCHRRFQRRAATAVGGLPRRLGERELDRLTRDLPPALNALEQRIERENTGYPEPVRVFLGGRDEVGLDCEAHCRERYA